MKSGRREADELAVLVGGSWRPAECVDLTRETVRRLGAEYAAGSWIASSPPPQWRGTFDPSRPDIQPPETTRHDFL